MIALRSAPDRQASGTASADTRAEPAAPGLVRRYMVEYVGSTGVRAATPMGAILRSMTVGHVRRLDAAGRPGHRRYASR